MPKLMIIVGSVRPGRIGPAIAEWVRQSAIDHGDFDVDYVDLLELEAHADEGLAHGRGIGREHARGESGVGEPGQGGAHRSLASGVWS